VIRTATLALLLAATANGTSHADPDLAAERDAQARAYFERGVAHVKAHRYLEARAEFAAGYELSHRPTFLFNMAECSRLDGRLDLAREGYERYLREAPTGPEAENAKKRLATLGDKVEPPPAPSSPTPAAPPPPPQIVGPPPMFVAPDADSPSPTTAVTACAGGTCDRAPWSQKQVIGVAVGATGLVFVATGLWYWRRSVSRGDQVTAACAIGCDWDAVKGTYDESQSARTGELVFVGLGVAAMAAGGYLYYLGMQERAHPRLGVAPQPNGAALTWSGSW